MLCITGNEKTVTSLKKRLARHPKAALQEIRLDLLEESLPISTDLDFDPQRLIFTCRASREGGGFEGPEDRRVAYLKSMLLMRPGWIDVELSTPNELRKRMMVEARKRGTRVLASHHLFDPGHAHRVQALLAEMANTSADGIKLAIAIQDACELTHLLKAGRRAKPNSVLLGMGPAGLLSRALYPSFGSTWTYAASRGGHETASGQLTVDDYRQWRLPPKPDTPLYVLLGGAQVMHSPGPRIYNRLFFSLGIQAVYLPVITLKAEKTLDLLEHLGLRGASVTMPLKNQLAAHMDRMGKEAQATGMVNTVTLEPGGSLVGDLTDGHGARAALERACGNLRGKRAVILGTGGTASAVAHGLMTAGVEVTILGRSLQRACEIAQNLSCNAGHLNDLARCDFQLLVQTTPVGSEDLQQTLVPKAELLSGKIVLDVVLGKETHLLRDTRRVGGTAVSGRSMWAEQGRLQLLRWLNLQVEVSELEHDP